MPTRSLSPHLRPFRPHIYTKMKVEYPPRVSGLLHLLLHSNHSWWLISSQNDSCVFWFCFCWTLCVLYSVVFVRCFDHFCDTIKMHIYHYCYCYYHYSCQSSSNYETAFSRKSLMTKKIFACNTHLPSTLTKSMSPSSRKSYFPGS